MEVSSFGLMLLAVLSGVCLAIIGVAFKIGQSRNVTPLYISMCMGIAGALFFGVQMNWSELGDLPTIVWVFALLNASGQIVAMYLVNVCLKLGPLSPLWAAMNLTFLPVILYSAIFFGEPVTGMQFAAVSAGILAVAFASQMTTGGGGADGDKKKSALPMKAKLIYGIYLLVILLSNSIVFITIKDLGTRPLAMGMDVTILGRFLAPIYFVLYIGLALFTGAAGYLQKVKPKRWGDLVKLGLLAAFGSISGLLLLKVCIPLPAALVFTLSGVMTIISGAVASVLFFREKIFWAWYATVGAGALAVVLANLG
jgi:drug/metabolite transporter (DMT)-like permease